MTVLCQWPLDPRFQPTVQYCVKSNSKQKNFKELKIKKILHIRHFYWMPLIESVKIEMY